MKIHEGKGLHFGRDRTVDNVKEAGFNIYGLKKLVENIIGSCLGCLSDPGKRVDKYKYKKPHQAIRS